MNEDWEEMMSYAPQLPEEEFDGDYQDNAGFAELEQPIPAEETQRDLPYDTEDYFESQETSANFDSDDAYDDYQSMPTVYGDVDFD